MEGEEAPTTLSDREERETALESARSAWLSRYALVGIGGPASDSRLHVRRS